MGDVKIIYEGRPSWLNYSGFIGLSVLFLISVINNAAYTPLFLAMVFYTIAQRMNFYATVTNTRIIARIGIFATKTYEIDIKDIRSINISQGVFQRIFGLGDLEFSTASGPMKEAIIKGVRNPEGLKEQIRSLKGV